MKTYQSILWVLLLTALFSACKKEKGPSLENQNKESYDVIIQGSTSSGSSLSATLESGTADISLKGQKSDKTSVTVIINFPASETESGKKESIGLVIRNLDATEEVWSKEDSYTAYPFNVVKNKNVIMDYVIDLGGEDQYFYSSQVTFSSGSVSLKREGDRLIGTFKGKLISDFGRVVNVNGSFNANLKEDGLE